jgi:Zn-dependent peptidase ImmA (M78 family)/transcriptional regulator with XRE-family HTH domain
MAKDDDVLVIPEQLVKARDSLGMQPEEVAKILGVDVDEIIKWEDGSSEPLLKYLWDLAELYQRNTEYFLKLAPALPDYLSFRLERRKIMKDLPSEVRKVIVRFDELCRAESEIEEALQEPRSIKLKKVQGMVDSQELAKNERNRLALGTRPIRDLRKLLIDQGVRVFTLPIPDIPANELSGLSWWHEKYGPCILLNGKNNSGRRQFTLAHEYAHLLLNDPPTVCAFMLDIPEEQFANRFAAEFLMPEQDIILNFPRPISGYRSLPNDQELGKFAGRYGVSLEAMGRRLEYLELVPKGTTNTKIAEWEKLPVKYRSPSGPRWRRQLGEEFISLAVDAYSKERISLSKLSEYLGQDLRRVRGVVSESKRRGE